jgi:hypothetical protein
LFLQKKRIPSKIKNFNRNGMSKVEVDVEQIEKPSAEFFEKITERIVGASLFLIKELMYTERIPGHNAEYFTTIFFDELRPAMPRFDIGETEFDFENYWNVGEEPLPHDIDNMSKHFVALYRSESKVKVQINREETLINLDKNVSPKLEVPAPPRFKSVKSENQNEGQITKPEHKSVMVGNLPPNDNTTKGSSFTMLKIIQIFKKSPRKILKHSKSTILKNFLFKPPIESKPFNKNIVIISTKEETCEKFEKVNKEFITRNTFGSNKMSIDNDMINRKEDEFRALKNAPQKSAATVVAHHSGGDSSPKKKNKRNESVDKSGFDSNGNKMIYRQLKDEDMNPSQFTNTHFTNKRGRSALPTYANGIMTRGNSKNRSGRGICRRRGYLEENFGERC